MSTANIQAASLPTVDGIGTGQTIDASTVVLCEMNLSAAERAGAFEAVAYSDQGEKRSIEALGFMKQPAEESDGWSLTAGEVSGDCSLSVSGATLQFSVTGASGTSKWTGRLAAVFTQSYDGSF